MRGTLALALALAVGCLKEPEWVEGCAVCGPNQLCTYGGAEKCVEVPEACAAAFGGECALDALDDACEQTLCGVDENASYEFSGECWSDGDRMYKYAYCSVY
jgi:hypothetical protein